jgi:hypothetical protein
MSRFYRQPWFWALAVIAVVVAIVLAGTALTGNRSKRHTIVYSITGTVRTATIVYARPGGHHFRTVRADGQRLPWTRTVTLSGDPTRFGVSAAVAHETGRIACRLTIDGKYTSARSMTASAPHVLCSGADAK